GLAVSVCVVNGVPEIVGGFCRSTAGAPLITADAAVVAVPEPSEFVPVMTTRSVLPTSAACVTYVCDVAPLMSAQLAPPLSQRRHWYVKVSAAGTQVPVLAVSVWPRNAWPPIVGGLPGSLVGTERSSVVGADVALPEPPGLLAGTTTTTVPPTSAACSTYVWPVAPLMFVQLAPLESHRCHW